MWFRIEVPDGTMIKSWDASSAMEAEHLIERIIKNLDLEVYSVKDRRLWRVTAFLKPTPIYKE